MAIANELIAREKSGHERTTATSIAEAAPASIVAAPGDA
jgi:hypothetical protein